MKNVKLHKIKNIILVSLSALLICVGIGLTLPTLSASADDATNSQLLNKALLGGLRTCYTSRYMKSKVSQNDYSRKGISSLMESAGSDALSVFVPSQQVGNTLTTPKISCEELLAGASSSRGSMTGLNSVRPIESPANIGYRASTETSNNAETCFWFRYEYPATNGHKNSATTNTVCVTLDQNRKFNPGQASSIRYDDSTISGGGPFYLKINSCQIGSGTNDYGFCLALSTKTSSTTEIIGFPLPETKNLIATTLSGLNTAQGVDISILENSGNQLASKLNNLCEPYGNDGYGGPAGCNSLGFVNTQFNHETSEETTITVYNRIADVTGATQAMRYFLNAGATPTWDSIAFSEQDEYNLYNAYLQYVLSKDGIYNVYIIDNQCSASLDDAKSLSDGGYVIPNNNGEWCPISGVTDVNSKFNLQASSRLGENSNYNFNVVNRSYRNLLQPANFGTVIERLVELGSKEEIDTSGGVVTPGIPGGDNDEAATDDVSCSSDVPSLGWIICPTLQFMGDATDGMYGQIEEDWLQVNAGDLKAESGEAIYDAWKAFRDFANVVFAIVLVIVILSQVTGIGVSNYGIKKILPSLIIVAVLVNISFFVCQLCVDLSNIIGVGVKEIFDKIGVAPGAENGFNFQETLSGLMASVGVVLTISIGTGYMLENPQIWVIPLLCALIVALISTIFFFIILAVRKVGIYILVMLAPLAIICYALPNTKRIFDRWKKLFTGLLVVYPICGLLMGGGSFAGRIIARAGSDSSSFITQLVAMLLQVVPFFFIPTVLKGSLNAIGQLGTRISNMGSRLGGNISGGIKRSDTAKRFSTSAGAWGADSGSRVSNKVRGFWRRVPGVGGVLRGFDNTKLGQSLANNRQARQVQSRQAYNAMQQKDIEARFTPGTARPGTEAYKIMESSAEIAYANRQAQASAERYRSNPDFNHGDIGFVGDELADTLDQIDADPTNNTLKENALGMSYLLLSGGKPGEDVFNSVFNEHLYKGSSDKTRATRGTAIQTLSSYVNNNEKFRANIKDHNAAQDNILKDVTNSGAPLKSLAKYQATVADKTSDFANSTSGYFRNLYSSINNGTLDGDFNQLLKAFNVSGATLQDSMLSKNLKADDIPIINEIRKRAYDGMLNIYKNKNQGKGSQQQLERAFVKEYGARPNNINPVSGLKVRH